MLKTFVWLGIFLTVGQFVAAFGFGFFAVPISVVVVGSCFVIYEFFSKRGKQSLGEVSKRKEPSVPVILSLFVVFLILLPLGIELLMNLLGIPIAHP